MLDISHTLINKLTLRFARKTSLTKSINTADMVKGILYDRLSEIYHLTSEWKHFSFGGKLISEDEMLKGQSASMTVDGVHTWAAYLNVKDPDLIRRRWVYYIGLKSDDADSAILYYAKCCYDHMAGSLQESKTPIEDFDQTPIPLFSNNHISCMCGSNILPHQAIELTHSNLPDLINLLTDSDRRQPVVLVTCISYLSPEKIAAMLLGNAAVFWTDNSSTVMRLNSLLPQNMYTIWESVRIFMPDAGEKTYNPIYTLENIRDMGLDKFYAGIRQACWSRQSIRIPQTLQRMYGRSSKTGQLMTKPDMMSPCLSVAEIFTTASESHPIPYTALTVTSNYLLPFVINFILTPHFPSTMIYM